MFFTAKKNFCLNRLLVLESHFLFFCGNLASVFHNFLLSYWGKLSYASSKNAWLQLFKHPKKQLMLFSTERPFVSMKYKRFFRILRVLICLVLFWNVVSIIVGLNGSVSILNRLFSISLIWKQTVFQDFNVTCVQKLLSIFHSFIVLFIVLSHSLIMHNFNWGSHEPNLNQSKSVFKTNAFYDFDTTFFQKKI